MSKSDELTEKSLVQLERKLKREYRKAYEGMKARYDEYINGSDEMDGSQVIHHQSLAERLAKEEEAYKQGKYTDAEWKAYVQTQIQRGERYQAMANDLANRMTNTNLVAEAYINDKTPGIYSLNANYQAYEIGQGLQGVSFTMYDEQTVKNLITENGNYTEFRTVKVNPVRDYEWNTKQINSALTSAILQGKSVDKLADSFMAVMKRNRSSAIRNARTAVTSAQNGGRMTSLRQAKAQGIEVRKQWLSAHDGRVRDSHAMLNGQIRDIEDEFDNGLMYPGDSNGIPSEVYNCRCTLTYIYPEYDDDESSEIYQDEALEGETYQQFVKRMKKAEDKSIIESNKRRYDSEAINGDKMAGIKGIKKTSITHSRQEQEELVAYGKEKGIYISNIAKFDGDSDILKEHIDNLEKLKNDFNIKKVKLSFREQDESSDLGWTSESGVIHLMRGTMGNRSDVEDYLNADNMLSSTKAIGISSHEFAHLLARTKGEKGFEIAEKAYYNVFKKEPSVRELLDYLNENISGYATKKKEFVRVFNKKDYKEILPEIFGKNSTNPNAFTEECYRIAKEVFK